jgi:hypothetical protein
MSECMNASAVCCLCRQHPPPARKLHIVNGAWHPQLHPVCPCPTLPALPSTHHCPAGLAGVHISLRAALSSGPEAASALANAYRQSSRGARTLAGAAEMQLDLSDATFLGLQRKVDSLALLKAQREAHAQELLQVGQAEEPRTLLPGILHAALLLCLL